MAKTKPLIVDPTEAKRWLRQFMVKKRQALGAARQKKLSQKIINNLLHSSEFKKAKTVAAFLGFASEVRTEGILEAGWKTGKTMLIPITTRGFDKPYFAVFHKGHPLQKTKHGHWELSGKTKAFNFKSIDLVLVPGLAFDNQGYRLGYGGGVYDRILKKTKTATHAGLFFSIQNLPVLPRQNHDQKLRLIVTEKGCTRR